MGGRKVDLLPPIRLQGCNLVPKLTVTWSTFNLFRMLFISYARAESHLES